MGEWHFDTYEDKYTPKQNVEQGLPLDNPMQKCYLLP